MDAPLHERVASDLRRRISSGELPVGSAIPSESHLCEQWGISRGPIRQALATLRAEGLIGGGRGKPPVVRSQSMPQPFETFLSFSRWVELMGRTPGQRTLEIARRPAGPEACDALGLEEGEHVVQMVRLRLMDDLPAMVERTTFVWPVGRLLFDFDCDSGSVFAYLSRCGVDLSRARHTIDAVGADRADSELLGIPVGAPLLRERRQTSSASGEPVEFSDDRYRPDLVSFTIDNSQQAHPALLRSPNDLLPARAPQGETP
ncbi:GntR family transcriptional regulator [Nonomuraea gerenzanensis]|uniref:Transcriptional regulator, GntR family n=1 Tax=Nonomuraea gerenzanensis TaxID=93944 RepID=A0A1M4EIH7_9ACTN|nr:GntR family transcriptional regulator [Nonomuraea gerenzanensis]UBU10242.1 GntR family transcriptional regulator [Nonomuraea gerenzanensis]SBO98620.1 Transcriptional regulator, GntR family [Nonomuraea gerenzanensis]